MKHLIYPRSKFIISSENVITFNYLNTTNIDRKNLFYRINKKITCFRTHEFEEIKVSPTNTINVIDFIYSKNGIKKIFCKKYVLVINELKILSFLYKIIKHIFSLENVFINPRSFISTQNNSKIFITGRIFNYNLKYRYILSCGDKSIKIEFDKNGYFYTEHKFGYGIKILKIKQICCSHNITLIDFRVIYISKHLIDTTDTKNNSYFKWNLLYNDVFSKNIYKIPELTKISIFVDGIDINHTVLRKFLSQFNTIDMNSITLFLITNDLFIKKIPFTFKINHIYEEDSFSSAVNRNLVKLKKGYTLFLNTFIKFPNDLFFILSSNIKKNIKLYYFDEYHSALKEKFQFKSSFDKIFLLSKNYIGTNFCISNELLKNYSLNVKSSICPFYDLLLKLSLDLKNSEVLHIPVILENNFRTLNLKSFQSSTLKLFHSNELQISSKFGSYSLLPPVITSNNSVSLIITTAGDIRLLNNFLTSIQNKTLHINYDIIIVTHSSNFVNLDKLNYFNNISSSSIRVIKHDIFPFNYSSIVNFAVSFSTATYVCLLNDDMEILNGNWLSELLRWFTVKDTGVVGSLLLYPDYKIQHAGISLGLNQICDHPDKGFSRFSKKDLPHINHPRSVTAVTGACLLIKKETFLELGGMNPLFAEAFNDIDLCLRVRKKGYNIICTPHSSILHYESISIGEPLSDSRRSTFRKEIDLFLKMHKESIDNEAFYSNNFSQNPPYYHLAKPPRNKFNWRPFQNKKSLEEKPKSIWKSKNITQDDKVCIFSHYDEDREIQKHVIYYLNELYKLNWSIFFITSCPNLEAKERSKIDNITCAIICSNGNGRDWGNYAMGYNYSLGITKAKNILFTNDSVWGPITSLKPFFNFAEQSSADILGLTDSYQTEYHIQSYFIYCKESVCKSELFKRFFENFIPQINKQEIIQQDEIGFSRLFSNSGYQIDSFFRYSDIKKLTIEKKAFGHELVQKDFLLNSTHHFSKLMISDLDFPFIKIELVKVNPSKIPDLESIIASIESKNYGLFKIVQSELEKLVQINQKMESGNIYSV